MTSNSSVEHPQMSVHNELQRCDPRELSILMSTDGDTREIGNSAEGHPLLQHFKEQVCILQTMLLKMTLDLRVRALLFLEGLIQQTCATNQICRGDLQKLRDSMLQTDESPQEGSVSMQEKLAGDSSSRSAGGEEGCTYARTSDTTAHTSVLCSSTHLTQQSNSLSQSEDNQALNPSNVSQSTGAKPSSSTIVQSETVLEQSHAVDQSVAALHSPSSITVQSDCVLDDPFHGESNTCSSIPNHEDLEMHEFHVSATSSTTSVVEDVAETRNSRIPEVHEQPALETHLAVSERSKLSGGESLIDRLVSCPVDEFTQTKTVHEVAADQAQDSAPDCLTHTKVSSQSMKPEAEPVSSDLDIVARNGSGHIDNKVEEHSDERVAVSRCQSWEDHNYLGESARWSSGGGDGDAGVNAIVVMAVDEEDAASDVTTESGLHKDNNDGSNTAPTSSGTSLVCSDCGKTLASRGALKNHLLVHSGRQSFRCETCKKCFSLKSNLQRHMRSHTNERAWSCDVCEKKFHEKKTLVTHQRIHTGSKPFKCDHDGCDREFRQLASLQSHRLTHAPARNHLCEVCGASFLRRSHYLTHLHGHTSRERKYSCSICSHAFFTASDCRRHMRIHAKGSAKTPVKS